LTSGISHSAPANGARAAGLAPVLAGLVYGLAYAAQGWQRPHEAAGAPSAILLEGLMLALLLPFALLLFRRLAGRSMAAFQRHHGAAESRFERVEPWTYGVLLVPAVLFGWGLSPGAAVTIGALSALVASQLLLFVGSLRSTERKHLVTSEHYIAVLFLISGFAALIYQVVWQRILFTTFGVNSESVTVIVSVFMFGLGIGALLGGRLQERFPTRLLGLFLALEIGIGLFGLVSLRVIGWVDAFGGTPSTFGLVLRTYVILGVPTLLMGATLPILVAYLQRYLRNIGKTVGVLYAFNTFGSAMAAMATVTVLFVATGLATTVLIAACCNFLTAGLIYHASRHLAARPPQSAESETRAPAHAQRIPYWLGLALLAAVGFISLSHEILWFRLLGYMTGSAPRVFGLLLAVVLAGIAAGALRAGHRLEQHHEPLREVIKSLGWAALVFYLAIPAVVNSSAVIGSSSGVLLAYVAAGAVAYLCGGILPLLMHLTVQESDSASANRVAWLYFANIVGATLGPLFTGFFLLDRFTLEGNVVLLTALTVTVMLGLAATGPVQRARRVALAAATAAASVLALIAHGFLYAGHLEKIQYASYDYKPFKHKVEDRSGIIAVAPGGSDIMYGNGAYDGRFNLDPVANSNGITRAYMIAALHPRPRKVLEIGLSTGSWTRVISMHEGVESMKVVEIGRSYPDVIRRYPDIAPILSDPKISIILDDGRRWLKHHPDEKFDVIVMNTTYHWRSNMTNLLSREFLELCRRHLNPGGVLYYNTTSSPDVVHTAAHVFQHVTMFQNFVAASDSPFDLPAEQRRRNLLRFKSNTGAPVFEAGPNHQRTLNNLAAHPLPDLRSGMLARPDLMLITDDNMAVEYKVGQNR
jgi:spermidine synthase